MTDERLEKLSDKVRSGITIDMSEALEVVNYQGELREAREKSWWLRFKHWFKY